MVLFMVVVNIMWLCFCSWMKVLCQVGVLGLKFVLVIVINCLSGVSCVRVEMIWWEVELVMWVVILVSIEKGGFISIIDGIILVLRWLWICVVLNWVIGRVGKRVERRFVWVVVSLLSVRLLLVMLVKIVIRLVLVEGLSMIFVGVIVVEVRVVSVSGRGVLNCCSVWFFLECFVWFGRRVVIFVSVVRCVFGVFVLWNSIWLNLCRNSIVVIL